MFLVVNRMKSQKYFGFAGTAKINNRTTVSFEFPLNLTDDENLMKKGDSEPHSFTSPQNEHQYINQYRKYVCVCVQNLFSPPNKKVFSLSAVIIQ